MTVPTLTVNGSRQALHWYMPGRWLLPLTSVASPIVRSSGRPGFPSGQRLEMGAGGIVVVEDWIGEVDGLRDATCEQEADIRRP